MLRWNLQMRSKKNMEKIVTKFAVQMPLGLTVWQLFIALRTRSILSKGNIESSLLAWPPQWLVKKSAIMSGVRKQHSEPLGWG